MSESRKTLSHRIGCLVRYVYATVPPLCDAGRCHSKNCSCHNHNSTQESAAQNTRRITTNFPTCLLGTDLSEPMSRVGSRRADCTHYEEAFKKPRLCSTPRTWAVAPTLDSARLSTLQYRLGIPQTNMWERTDGRAARGRSGKLVLGCNKMQQTAVQEQQHGSLPNPDPGSEEPNLAVRSIQHALPVPDYRTLGLPTCMAVYRGTIYACGT